MSMRQVKTWLRGLVHRHLVADDPDDVARRAALAARARQAVTFRCSDCAWRQPWPADTTLVRALETGCPICGGVNWRLATPERVVA